MDDRRMGKGMKWAIAISLGLHAIFLSVKFAVPAIQEWRPKAPVIMAILVNAKTKQDPSKPTVIAQESMDGGGQVEEKGWMPSSPVERAPTELQAEARPNPSEAQRKVDALEREVAQMMAATKESAWKAPAGREPSEPKSDEAAASKVALELAARIDKQAQAYASRPKKAFVGLQAAQSDLAAWVEGWQRKVEATGEAFYPEQAQGKVRGTLILTAGIARDGSIASIEIERSSGRRILDQSAQRILALSAPFEPFDEKMAKKVDILYITRQWRFGPSGLERLEAGQEQPAP